MSFWNPALQEGNTSLDKETLKYFQSFLRITKFYLKKKRRENAHTHQKKKRTITGVRAILESC